jgi:hypothetical protein
MDYDDDEEVSDPVRTSKAIVKLLSKLEEDDAIREAQQPTTWKQRDSTN